MLSAHLGRVDDAFAWLETAVDERAVWLTFLHSDPVWDIIRDDPRFGSVTDAVGLRQRKALA